MNTDAKPESAIPSPTYPLKEQTHQIIGCAFEVLNELGHGLNEKCYENALVVEFGLRGITYSQQRRFDVLYKRHRIGLYVPRPNRLRPDNNRHEGNRTNYGPRKGADVELFADYEMSRRIDPEFHAWKALNGSA